MNWLLKIENLTTGYEGKVVLEKTSFTLNENDFVGIIGPNGGGKTTLLKTIMGLLPPMKGSITFSDSIKNPGTDIGYLPQINKFDHRFPITVSEVIRSGLSGKSRWFQRFSTYDNKKVNNMMSELGISEVADKPVGALSGGQMQRVFLGRAIISNPKILILDEPDTYVDNQFEAELYHRLKELNKTMAILLVSHDIGTISTHVKSIACVNKQLHYHPSNIITPEQLKSYNCPIQIITHGDVPHTVLKTHNH